MNLPPGVTIEWAQNPLFTKVILDEGAQREFKLRHVLQRVIEDAYSAYFYLDTESEFYDTGKARAELDYIVKEDRPDVLAQRYHAQAYLDSLQDRHCGDCCCIPCSCEKCHAEVLLGIDTLPGLSKYAAHYIALAFKEEGIKTAAQAVTYLRNREITASPEHQHYLPRWRSQNEEAAAWLENYLNTNLKGEAK